MDWNALVPTAISLITLFSTWWGFNRQREDNEKREKEKYVRDAQLDRVALHADDIEKIPSIEKEVKEIRACVDGSCRREEEHAAIFKQHEESIQSMGKSIVIIKEAQKCQLRSDIVRLCRHGKDRGWASPLDKQIVSDEHEVYINSGGDGYVDQLVPEFMKLPDKPEKI